MIRKLLLSATSVAALMIGVLAAPASAQTVTPTPTPFTCNVVDYNGCIAYPDGGFGDANAATTPTPTPTPAPFPTATTVPVETDVTATATAGGEASIAFTGSESRVLGYVGAGLIGFGAVALATARRKGDSDS